LSHKQNTAAPAAIKTTYEGSALEKTRLVKVITKAVETQSSTFQIAPEPEKYSLPSYCICLNSKKTWAKL